MAWHPECPNSPLPFSSGSIAPHRVVFHRTIGTWPGDYSVLSRGSVPSVHFLVGQAPGQWVQWYSTGQKCAHAAGANDGVGIELSGQNGEALTDWQIEACGKIVRWLIEQGIAPTFLDSGPRVSDWQGFGNHSNVVTTPALTHYDYIDRADFERMVGSSTSTGDDEMRGILRTDSKGAVWFVTGNTKSYVRSPEVLGVIQFLAKDWCVGGDGSVKPAADSYLNALVEITDTRGLLVRLGQFIAKLFPKKAERAGGAPEA